MTTEKQIDWTGIEIEICTSEEWLCDGISDDTTLNDSDFAREYASTVFRFLENAGLSYKQIEDAKGQRCMCHGWNGAHFKHRAGGLGTFDSLTADQLEILEAADAAGYAAIDELKSEHAITEE